MSRIDEKFKEKWTEISNKNYAEQAKFFMNGFWDEVQNDAETIYKLWQKIVDLDADQKKEGRDLDEFEAHKFLETLGETLTVIALRERLRKIDLDNNNRMSLLEYLVFKYNKTVEQVVNSPQGDNRAEIEEAQVKVEAAQAALAEVTARLEEQKHALAEQKKAEQAAEHDRKVAVASEQAAKKAEEELRAVEEELHKAEEEVRKTENAAKAAEAEVKKTLDELKKQEDDFNNKCTQLEKQTKEGTIVQKNKAVQELAALKSEDPLPLRKAKISQESALRKAEKSRKEAEAATNAAAEKTAEAKAKTTEAEAKTADAKAKRVDAEAKTAEAKANREAAELSLAAAQQARAEAEEATRQVEQATLEAEAKVQEANDYLEEVKKKPGASFGNIWFMQREITEAKKYLPKSKQ